FIGSIEGNCSNGEPSKARSEFPVDPRAPERFFRAKSRLSFHLCNIRRVAASCRKRTMALFSPGAGAGAYSGNALGTAGIVRNGHLRQLSPFLAGSLFAHGRACTLVTFVPGTHHC